MAYVPVNFDLHDFQLNLDVGASAKFHKRLKELGFTATQNSDTMIYTRGKSRITAFVQAGSSLSFLPDFFDDTPGGTVYAIMEKMCMAFGGTMIGRYTIDGVNNQWDVRISQGMNLSGKPDVGSRDHVVDENAAGGHLAPSTATRTGSGASKPTAGTQQNGTQSGTQGSQSATGSGGGEVESGQQGESQRDKLYRVLVEETYQKYVQQKGEDVNVYFNLIRNFNQQFPKEEETEAPSPHWEEVADKLMNEFGLGISEDHITNMTLLADHIASTDRSYVGDAVADVADSMVGKTNYDAIAHMIEKELFKDTGTFDAQDFIDNYK